MIELRDTVTGDDDSFLLTVTLLDEVTLLQVPQDLTDYQEITFLAQDRNGTEIRKKLSEGGVALRPQSGDTLGQAIVSIDSADTAQWRGSARRKISLYVEVEIVNPAGKIRTPITREKWVLLREQKA